MIYVLYLTLLFIAELAYFKIADHYNIIDKPNHRSSHSEVTIRGGGIIFPISVLLWFVASGFQYPLFVLGLMLISAVSFIDDFIDFSKRIRLSIHLLAMFLVFLQFNMFALQWYTIAAICVFFIGAINAYNFMDGINGITGTYSMVALASLLWINVYKVAFVDTSLLLITIIGVLVFNFFNSRPRAKCFAGDVGSISMAFIISFLLMKLILQTADIRYILLLVVYGIDTALTLALRLVKGENIFLAHRKHLYQLLVNEHKYKHLSIAFLYGGIQIIINLAVLHSFGWGAYKTITIFIVALLPLYIMLRLVVNKQQLSKT